MPRKKKSENTVESKSKATKKKSTKKVAASTESLVEVEATEEEFSISQIVNWTDEECKAREDEFAFKVSDVRDILKTVVDLNEKFAETTNKFRLLRDTLQKGYMKGYKITCPHCKREYEVNSMELNRKDTIMCKICGTSYKEDENISGVSLSVEVDEKLSEM